MTINLKNNSSVLLNHAQDYYNKGYYGEAENILDKITKRIIVQKINGHSNDMNQVEMEVQQLYAEICKEYLRLPINCGKIAGKIFNKIVDEKLQNDVKEELLKKPNSFSQVVSFTCQLYNSKIKMDIYQREVYAQEDPNFPYWSPASKVQIFDKNGINFPSVLLV